MTVSRIALLAGVAASALYATEALSQAAPQPLISRTTDGTLSWSGSNFSGAQMFYQATLAYSAGTSIGPFASTVSLFPSNSGFATFNTGGMTFTQTSIPPLGPGQISPPTVPVQYSGNGAAGTYGWQYTTFADTTGAEPLTLGSSGGLATLNFNDGGFENLPVGNPPIDFYVFVYLPGNWTTIGTSTGDITINGIADPRFTIVAPTYNSGLNQTTIEAFSTDYTGTANTPVDLNFTLYGGPVSVPPGTVPEAPTWAMLMAGFVGLAGLVGARRRAAGRA
ncbi:MAG TPA: hypothetical protein VEH77_09015 [Roseiarcus sp.]|nr:hypothetical protein [Roseiarcus sp.]